MGLPIMREITLHVLQGLGYEIVITSYHGQLSVHAIGYIVVCSLPKDNQHLVIRST